MDNKIKDVLKERNITQKQLAEMTGMTEVGISNAVNGSASKDTIRKVADALGVDESDLLPEKGLYAIFSSDKTPLRIGNVELDCYVLNNGKRVFSGRGIQKALNVTSTSGTWLSKFVNSEVIAWCLKPGILEQFNNPIQFRRNNAGGSQSVTNGYEATLLIDLCSAVIDAYENRHDSVSEQYYAAANVIIRAVAKTGIIALVDEVTGYEKVRKEGKDTLQKYLQSFISQEAENWIKMFDDQFFEDIYKMRNWTWEKTTKRPGFVGKIINDVVYERIAPIVYTKLNEINPKNENGNRRFKHHQFLTSEVGKPILKSHLNLLHGFALASDFTWWKFMLMLDKACPKQHQQLALFDDWDIE